MANSSDGAVFQIKRLMRETTAAVNERLDSMSVPEHRRYIEKLKRYSRSDSLTGRQRARLESYLRRLESFLERSR